MTFKLTVDGFREGGTVPRRHTCDGEDLSPALEWEDAPVTTKSFVLIVDDPDAPVGTWNHWLLWDIPTDVNTIAESYRPGTLGVDGTSDFGRAGYGGPCPPRGHGQHRYFFKVLAMDVASIELPARAKRAALDNAVRGHVLAEAQYMGRYERA
ncbi:MAG: YbhB/YbcL family Raf kinase inhibitor-like protein [bacterium]|nr:YbhB/YbcL family Raf kinase inhibitor-like protein [bacterium]